MSQSAALKRNTITHAISANFPVVYVVTWEEERLLRQLQAASNERFGDGRPVWLVVNPKRVIDGRTYGHIENIPDETMRTPVFSQGAQFDGLRVEPGR